MISIALSSPSGGKIVLFVCSGPAVVPPLPHSQPQTLTLHSASHDVEELLNLLVIWTFSSYLNGVSVSLRLRSAHWGRVKEKFCCFTMVSKGQGKGQRSAEALDSLPRLWGTSLDIKPAGEPDERHKWQLRQVSAINRALTQAGRPPTGRAQLGTRPHTRSTPACL